MKIVTRQEAFYRGLSKYYNGKRCKHGHDSERYTLTSNCAECTAERTDKTREKFRALRDDALSHGRADA